MAVDLHPDIVKAIRDLGATSLGRKYDRWSRKRYGVSGAMLAAKTVAGEFGGRSTKSGRGVVSSAGARGPAQFIPSTRAQYMKQYGIDPWADDRQAIEAMVRHHMNTGVEGYNPGMPTYKDYILGQKIVAEDRKGIRQRGAGRAPSTDVELEQRVIPGQSFEAERQAARRDLLLGGPLNLKRLLDYKAATRSLADVPERVVSGDITVRRDPGAPMKVKRRSGGAPRAGGSFSGTTRPVIELAKIGHSFGLRTSSGKRDTVSTSSGNVSDHYRGNTSANARDLAGSVPDMDRAAVAIARRLGLKGYKKGQPLEATVTRNGIRYQVLYRTHTGGNHFDHIHVGARRV